MKEILTKDLPPLEQLDDFIKVAKLQVLVADAGLKFQSRVDETALRQQQIDFLPELLQAMKKEKTKLGILIDMVE